MTPTDTELRLAALAVCVLRELDLEPADTGVLLPGEPRLLVGWTEIRTALAGSDPGSELGRDQLERWLRTRRRVADLGPALFGALRPLGLPVGHVLHPGPDWVRRSVLGGALHLGFGLAGLDPETPTAVVPVPPAALAQVDVPRVWAAAARHLEHCGALAVHRLSRDTTGLLRPIGECDVVTLLGSSSLRTALAGDTGMTSVAVPMRTRGWTRLALIDPAFALAAAAATDAEDRGFPRPLLVTRDEVSMVAAGGRTAELALRESAGRPVRRTVRYL